ncbi:MAG: NUDIX domain-containing protein [Patescibacteria group bacterium]
MFKTDTGEILDLVDRDDKVIGQKKRSEIYAENLSNFRVINVFVVNKEEKIWIPRRSPDKRMFPLCLDMSVGGHVGTGETYEEAFRRETMEELGVNIDDYAWKEIGKLTPHQDGISAFSRVYQISMEKTPNYNEQDFTEYFWLTPREFFRKLKAGDKAKEDLPKIIERFYGTN